MRRNETAFAAPCARDGAAKANALAVRPGLRDLGRPAVRSALKDQAGIMTVVVGRAADVQPVEPAGRLAHSVGSLIGEEVFPRTRLVPEPVLVTVAALLLVAPLLPVDAVGDHRDDPDHDSDCEDSDCCDEGDGCHVLRPLTCSPAVIRSTGSDLGGLSDTVDTGQTGVGNWWTRSYAPEQLDC